MRLARIWMGFAIACAPVMAQGIITTFAGTGNCGYSGDGGTAAAATVCGVNASAVDRFGNIYFPDRGNHRIRKIAPDGTITTIAGNGSYGTSGDGGPALSATLGWVAQVAVYISNSSPVVTAELCFGDTAAYRIRCVDLNSGYIYGFGTGVSGTGGDGGNISAASFMYPEYVAFDESGNFYISDSGANSVRMVAPSGIINTIVGPGPGYCCLPLGDGGPALGANIYQPRGVYARNGALYIADSGNLRIRKVDFTSGIISTVAGNGNPYDSSGAGADGGSALMAGINPYSIVADPAGNLFLSTGTAIREVDTNGIINTIAGTQGASGYGPDDVPATQTALSGASLGWDAFANRLLIGDANRFRQIFFTPPTQTRLTSSENPAVPGDTVTFQAMVTPMDATGSVRFYNYGTLLGSAPVSGGIANFSWKQDFGTFGIRAVYGGDFTHNLSQSATVTQVGQNISTTTTLTSSPNPSGLGQSVTFTAVVYPADAAGNVVFWVGGLGHQSPLSGGISTYTTSTLPAGANSVSANYSGDPRHLSSWSAVVSQAVQSGTSTTTLSSSPNPSAAGAAVILVAAISPATATGSVQFFNGANFLGAAAVSGGTALFTVTSLPVGTASLTAVYSGDATNAGSTSSALAQTVTPASTTATLSANPASSATVGQTVAFTAAVTPAAATGTVQLLDGGTAVGTAALTNGSAVFAVSTLTVGSHTLTANYSGDGSYNASVSAALTYSVVKGATSINLTSSLNPATFGAAVTLTAVVSPATATGSVQFFNAAGPLGSAALSGGTAQLTVSSLPAGSSTLTAVYSGDAANSGSNSTALIQTVTPASTTATLSANPASSATVGQTIKFTAAVTPEAATGTVQLLDGGSVIGTATLSSGSAVFAISTLAVGSHTLTAGYDGNGNYNGSLSAALAYSVTKSATSVSLTSSLNPATFGATVNLTASISPASATGSVQFFNGATSLGSAALSGGTAQLAIASLPVGTASLTAAYSGDAANAGSTSAALVETVSKAPSSTALTASPASPTNVGQTVTFTASLKPGSATGTVQFLDGGTVIGTGAVNGGTAVFAASSLASGTHSITAAYSGDGNFNPSQSAAIAQQVVQLQTATSLSSTPNPSTFGATVILTANVSPVVATGTVQFFSGSVLLGASSASQAQLVLATLPAGANTLTAVYSGDAIYAGSTSPALVQTVNKANSTTTLSASPAGQSSGGQAVAFTAIVSPAAATGPVQFRDGGQLIGTAVLQNGVAVFSTSSLKNGNHTITASYPGDANVNASQSAPLAYKVHP